MAGHLSTWQSARFPVRFDAQSFVGPLIERAQLANSTVFEMGYSQASMNLGFNSTTHIHQQEIHPEDKFVLWDCSHLYIALFL